LKILSIGAHPDDIEIGCGGALAMHKKNGDVVYGILCTLGGVRGDPLERRKEASGAAKILGLKKLYILDYPVSKLNDVKSKRDEFVKVLKKLFDEIKPDRIYTHSPFDFHQVHVTVSGSVSMASMQSGIKQLIFFETISSTTMDFRPNAYVDISDFIDTKIESIMAHKSQAVDRFYLQPNVVKSLANTRYVWGKVGDNPKGLAEAFSIQRIII
jgi:LmbE family N-acetylglucosaminyl deacetylase